jgi:hypothetical protein
MENSAEAKFPIKILSDTASQPDNNSSHYYRFKRNSAGFASMQLGNVPQLT